MIAQSIFKVPNGKLLRITVDYQGDILLAVQIHGDFFLHPEETISAVEGALTQAPLEKEGLRSRIQEILDAYDAQLVGADAEAIAHAILLATGKITS